MAPLTRPTLTNLIYLGAGETLTRGLSFVAFAYLGRILEPAQFGTLGAALAVLMVCSLVIDQGFGMLGSRNIAKRPGDTESLVHRVVSVQLLIAVGVVVLLVAATYALPLDPTLALLLRGLAFSLLGIPFMLNWVFQGRNRMFWFAAPSVLRWGIFLAIVVVLVHAPKDVSLLPFAEIGGVAAAGICYVVVYRRLGCRLRIGLGSAWDPKLLRDALPIGISNLIWAVRMYMPVLVVLGLAGKDAAGFFESAHRIVMVFLALLGVYFTNIFPAMSSTSVTSHGEFVRILRRALQASTAATLAVCVVTFFTAPWMITVVFGEQYVTPDAVQALIILTCVTPVLAWRRTGRCALIVIDHQRVELVCSLVGVVLLVGLLFALTRSMGIAGAAWAMVISELVATILTWLVLRPRLRELKAGAVRGA